MVYIPVIIDIHDIVFIINIVSILLSDFLSLEGLKS